VVDQHIGEFAFRVPDAANETVVVPNGPHLPVLPRSEERGFHFQPKGLELFRLTLRPQRRTGDIGNTPAVFHARSVDGKSGPKRSGDRFGTYGGREIEVETQAEALAEYGVGSAGRCVDGAGSRGSSVIKGGRVGRRSGRGS